MIPIDKKEQHPSFVVCFLEEPEVASFEGKTHTSTPRVFVRIECIECHECSRERVHGTK